MTIPFVKQTESSPTSLTLEGGIDQAPARLRDEIGIEESCAVMVDDPIIGALARYGNDASLERESCP